MAGASIGHLCPILIHNGKAIAGHRQPSAAGPYSMFDTVMVHHDHASLGLSVLVMQGDPNIFLKPADHFGVQRLARAGGDAELASERVGHFIACRDHHPVNSGRAREIRDVLLAGDLASRFDRKPCFLKRDRTAQQQRADRRIIQPIGPSRIGDISEAVVRAQIKAMCHITLKGAQRFEWHTDTFWRACCPAGEKHEEQVITTQKDRREIT